MNDFWNTILDFSQDITSEVGKQLMRDFGKVHASQKADGSLVTQSDQWADQAIRDAIAGNFSGYGVLSEEGDHVFPHTEWCWVIDPLDGTTNFTRGIPIWSISLGLLYRGTPIFGYVFVPPLNQRFHGFWPGDSGLQTPVGAFLNNHPIHTSKEEATSNHFFNLCSRSTGIIRPGFPCKLRMLGVASYNFLTVSSGAVLAGMEATPKVWDIAGAWVILQAAGGTWISLEDAPFPLLSGLDYGDRSFPTLVISDTKVESTFGPFVVSAGYRIPVNSHYSYH